MVVPEPKRSSLQSIGIALLAIASDSTSVLPEE
ncbi:hypothetical protein NK6_4800 [Bradyrhizobium diazoefficiens]|uniref:Uncharacterized protein n=1 Tax=Bradyrhizobium diazoefficiens TaxID=1355477 RepID=A0A0E4FU30_9BRAD|nr:hypothetical protein NK6_4800 [Bradyrhizobium diazoefficiens]